MAVRRNYRINLRNYGNPPAIMVSQYDENYDLVFEVYDGVVPATGLNAYTVKLVGRQPGDDPALKYEFTGTVSGMANNILSFTIDTTMTGKAGKGTAEIVILDTTNDVKFASFNLPVYVEKAAVPDDAIDADVERAQEIAEQVQEIVDTAAAEVKGEAESWAVGERDGEPVSSDDPTYENNAKYYSQQAAQIAEDISGVTEQVATNTSDISDLKEDLNNVTGFVVAKYESGYIDCNKSYVDINNVISDTSYKHCVIECTKGDCFFVNGTGALQARSWCFIDSSGNPLSVQSATGDYIEENTKLIAPSNSAYLISNYRISQTNNAFCIKQDLEALNSHFLTSAVLTDGLYAIEMPTGGDLNNFKTPNNYSIRNIATAQTISNIPVQYGGRLIVIRLIAGQAFLQIYITTNNLLYIRTGNNAGWGAWKQLEPNILGLYLNHSNTVGLTSGVDLNVYRTTGNYRIGSVAIAETISNIPAPYGGRLTVLNISSANTYKQIYETTNGLTFWRTGNDAGWGAWRETADEVNINSQFLKYTDKGISNILNTLMNSTPYNIRYANAVKPLDFKNYLGNTQNVHPKVLYFADGFGGHKYWMAYTPYPKSVDKYENPCVAYSDDGLKWTNIAENPLSDPEGDGYNSDTHLVIKNGTLECWYRYISDTSVSPVTERICRRTTTDGVTWTSEETLYETSGSSYSNLLSPAVIWDGSKYCVWVVSSSTINYYETDSNGNNWSFIRNYSITFTDNGVTVAPWHIDVIKESDRYILLTMCRRNAGVSDNRCSLFIATSTDNISYTTPYIVIATGSGNWDNFMYRSSIVKNNNSYRIYYSAGTGGATSLYGGVWHMGIAESATLEGFKGLYV